MARLFKHMIVVLVVLLAGTAVQAKFELVENFDALATGKPDGVACSGLMGGIWDTEGENTGNVNIEDRDGSRVLQFRGHSSGVTRGVGFNGITNTIDDSEAGKVFLRFMLRASSETPRTYIGLISDTTADPITDTGTNTNTDIPMTIPVGFGLVDNGSGGFDLVKTDGTTVLKAGLERAQWYNVWIVANNEADTLDLYLSEATGPAGAATLPSPADLVASDIPFGVATTEPLNGMIFACPGGTGQSTRTYVDEIWWDGDKGLGKVTKAGNQSPANEATDVPRDVVLSWTPGEFAPPTNGHKVYLSENFSDVNDGIGGVTQDANSYTPPQRLDFSTTYYWRVDEVNGPPDYTVFEGKVWSFTTEPFSYVLDNITAIASSSDPGKGPGHTVDGSGLDDSGLLHSKDAENNMWLSSMTGSQPTWIEFQFDDVYKLHEMWVWNSNQSLEPVLGLGFKDVTIEYSVNGTDYMTLGTTHEFARALGLPDYAHDTTVDLSGVAAKYIRLTANSNWGGILNQYGLSEVRFFYIPVLAREPRPESGATDVSIGTIDAPTDVTIGFRAGREAARHDVYLSTDQQAVIDGTAAVTTVAEARHGPLSLDLGQTYYWRVDEVNDVETPTMWQGPVWDFTTQEYYVLDDFESYNDLDLFEPESNRIFLTWIDGYDVATNGSLVGYDVPPFAEQSIVHGDSQSMPLFYDNSGTANYSEATMTLTSGSDWTIRGVKALSLWFRGNPAALVEEPTGTFKVNASGADIWGTSDEFRYVWKQLSGDGEIIAKVLSVQQTDNWAKAGVMIRNTLDPDSTNAMAFITDSGRVGWQYRPMSGGTTTSTRSDEGAVTAPHWVKLSRQGNMITAKHSSDGVTWEDMVETANPQEPSFKNMLMAQTVYVGLALTSHVSSVTCEAIFSDVTATGAVTGVFTEQAIGVDMPANEADAMYVALSSSGGTPAAVYHDDPSATQIGNWTEWLIDLQAFADQGVNLANINTIAIGFGDKNNPQPGGLGLVYVDDIRLYPSR